MMHLTKRPPYPSFLGLPYRHMGAKQGRLSVSAHLTGLSLVCSSIQGLIARMRSCSPCSV